MPARNTYPVGATCVKMEKETAVLVTNEVTAGSCACVTRDVVVLKMVAVAKVAVTILMEVAVLVTDPKVRVTVDVS